ncbi:WD domain, G-beta repeat, partial [Rhizoctonia solani]
MSKSNATVKGKEGIDRRLRSELMALSSTSGLLGPIGTVASILLDCFDAIKSQQDYEDLATDLAQLSESLVKRFGENTSNTMFGSVAGISKQMADEAMDVKNKTQRGVSTGRSLIEESDEDELMRHCRRIQSLFRQLQSIADEILIVRTCTSGRFATKPVESRNSDLAGVCSESREDRFVPCRLATDLPHRLASYTPSAAARLCVSFLSHTPSHKLRELVWAAHPRARLAVGRPRSTLAASQPRGFPNLTGLGLVAGEDERAEDKLWTLTLQQRAPHALTMHINQTRRALNWLRKAFCLGSPEPTDRAQGESRLVTSLKVLSNVSGAPNPLRSAATTLIDVFETIEEAGATEKQHDYKDSATDLAVSVESATEYFKQEGSYRRFRYISEIAKVIENEAARMKISMGPDALIRGPATAKLDKEEVMQHYRRIYSLFQQLKSELNAATWCMGNEMMVNTRAQQLYPASEAVFDSAISSDIGRRTCTEGTRTQVLDDLAKWASDPDAPSVFWMNGMAGTGKTTIATTFSQRLEHNNLLVASFFCTRTSPECRDVNRIVPTIANQLARYSPSFQRGLCDSLGVDPRTRSGITEEFELLLMGPLQEMDMAKIRSQVVVIDGLDECEDREVIGEILEMTFRYASQLPIKFFVTSRPIPEIVRIMGAHPGSSTVMLLHDIETLLVSADIELCLREGLAYIFPPVSDAVIKLLVEKSGVLFIYAAVLLRYVNRRRNGQDRSKSLLETPCSSWSEPVDLMYMGILQSASVDNEELWGRERDDIRMVIHMVVLAQEPIHAETIAILSNTNEHRRVEHALSLLLPIIRYSESTRLASTLHMSLQEFVFDQKRSGEYFCNVVEQIPVLARRCFQVMEDQLRMNICDLPSSFVPDDKVEDLQDRIEKNISPAL